MLLPTCISSVHQLMLKCKIVLLDKVVSVVLLATMAINWSNQCVNNYRKDVYAISLPIVIHIS